MTRKNALISISAEQAKSLEASHVGASDWARVDAMTESDLDAAIRNDPDWQDVADFDWSGAEFLTPGAKIALSIRIDPDVLDFFKAGGKGYQSRINAVLRHYVETRKKAGNGNGR